MSLTADTDGREIELFPKLFSVTETRLTADGVSFSDMSIRCLAELFEILVTRPGAEEGPLPTDAFFYRVIGHSSDNATFFTNR